MKKIILLFILTILVYISITYLFFQNGKAEGDTTVKLVSFNVRSLYSVDQNSQYFDAMKHNLDLMELYAPDVLLLQEHRNISDTISDKKIREVLGLEHFVFFHYADNPNGLGMAIYSRFPIKETQTIKLRPQWKGRSLGLASININDRLLNVGVVHFPNKDMYDVGEVATQNITAKFLLKEFFGDNIRTKQAEHLVEVTQDLHGSPLIIGGDFNTVPFSRTWRLMHKAFVDGSDITGKFEGTRSIPSGHEVKIDHFFHTKSVESIESSVGYKQGSDHRPIIMKIRF